MAGDAKDTGADRGGPEVTAPPREKVETIPPPQVASALNSLARAQADTIRRAAAIARSAAVRVKKKAPAA